MDMANLFKHFFREFSTFLVFCSSFFELCCLVCITSGVESFCLKFERFFILSLTVQKWLSGCCFFFGLPFLIFHFGLQVGFSFRLAKLRCHNYSRQETEFCANMLCGQGREIGCLNSFWGCVCVSGCKDWVDMRFEKPSAELKPVIASAVLLCLFLLNTYSNPTSFFIAFVLVSGLQLRGLHYHAWRPPSPPCWRISSRQSVFFYATLRASSLILGGSPHPAPPPHRQSWATVEGVLM